MYTMRVTDDRPDQPCADSPTSENGARQPQIHVSTMRLGWATSF